jgi:hypothetical protein
MNKINRIGGKGWPEKFLSFEEGGLKSKSRRPSPVKIFHTSERLLRGSEAYGME